MLVKYFTLAFSLGTSQSIKDEALLVLIVAKLSCIDIASDVVHC